MSFTDNFNGEGSNVNLPAHTPSGGGSWVRVADPGTDDTAALVSSTGILLGTQPGNNTAFWCDDQESADQYIQFKWAATGHITGYVCNRLTNNGVYHGIRITINDGGTLQLVRDGATVLGEYIIGSVPTGSIIRYEISGNDHTVKLDGVTRISVTDATNASETRQGVVARSEASTTEPWIDDFEAGTLGGGALTAGAESAYLPGGLQPQTSPLLISKW